MAEYDDGAYYEVQLNNKQLVFFFMAALAIAVVVFLCGVMVGRGVRDATLSVPGTDIAAGTLRQIPESRSPARAGTPKLDYAQRLEEEEPPAKLEPVRSTNPETTVQAQQKASVKVPPPARSAPKPPQPQQLGGASGAFTIQVVALKTEDAAKSLLSRLRSKHYRAYLEAGGEAGLHRVRVGRFATRVEAEKVAEKLRSEEKFKPYITQ
jgi:cell division septation protein DedD